ncbi:hypothetical protein BAUCODRAFT_542127 [Baudoinia panamericana UAMH 10762]|uniref:Tetraspanin Tsp3 n=1 Tax=Baudoinia panamericana (strain UAMH 10762) TaxID=717646 RepID=M2MFN4_BAUPA|nr:uncharacterized protein BAUCODRAFT_542127 [Baudoinia panamericana UAMH 10762]EMC95456.1 hypothetical protein BAUCODRAFT_542127 [Baudoinia panamericana UAMH 10762]
MAITRRQIVTGVSVVYLSALTALAAYALHSAHVYSLPIADIIAGLCVALPPLAGIALEAVIAFNEGLAAKGHLQTSRVVQITIVAFLIFETVLATLAGTHISPPGSLDCALREQWQSLFRARDAETIQKIQDAFQCCGLNSPKDMAYPFPGNGHNADACMVRYERTTACIEPWRDEERKVAIMLLIVPLAVFVWKIAILLSPSSSSAWLPSAIRLPNEQGSVDGGPKRQAIQYRDVEDAEEGSVRAEVDRLNHDSTLASTIEGSRSRSNGPWREHDRWRESGEEAD